MKETILLVDDNNTLREITRRLLAGGGYRVLEARTPDEALGVCERYKEPIDLLLSDIVMPEMSGQELYKRVAVLRPGIKVLLMSCYISGQLLKTAVPFLQKPFNVDDLAREVRKALDGPPNNP